MSDQDTLSHVCHTACSCENGGSEVSKMPDDQPVVVWCVVHGGPKSACGCG